MVYGPKKKREKKLAWRRGHRLQASCPPATEGGRRPSSSAVQERQADAPGRAEAEAPPFPAAVPPLQQQTPSPRQGWWSHPTRISKGAVVVAEEVHGRRLVSAGPTQPLTESSA
ncbi:hypothetical protein I4F81_005238 [Pyropia yezoensis]|uniref:Uncharacterized protein n=1 Tax=Pyropia yezoensis TaxID=2788 RepID=A0ACC3BY46_PYRYE|nr:hypothetical protein I4F81_005238 [Neopyropia yezoensis]